MKTLRRMMSRLHGALFGRREQELVDELESHIEMQTEENLRAGMSPEEARRAAASKFGSLQSVLESYRDQRGLPFVESVLSDIRYAVRGFRKNPAFTLTVLMTLAIGIGANTAIFSVLDALLLKRLPVENPAGLAVLYTAAEGKRLNSFSYPVFEQIQQRNHVFSHVFALGESSTMRLNANGDNDEFESVQASRVSAGFFSALGVQALVGRTIPENLDGSGEPQNVAVISYGLWRRKFGGYPQAIGRQITLNDTPFTIIGVAPQRFFGVEVGRSPDMWLPLVASPRLKADPQVQWIALLARLRPRLTLDAARNEIDALFRQLQGEKASNGSAFFGGEIRGITLASGATGWTPALRDQFTSQLVILIAMAAFVLLVACANVSSLLLARGGARRRELTIRLAIGGDRSRLVRQLFTESVVLALAGGVLGLSVAYWGTRLLLVYMPSEAGSELNASLDTRALAFTLGLSFLSAVLLGLIPAIRATRLDLTPALNNQETVSNGRSRRPSFQYALITFQVALSLILLVSAGLFVQTLHNLRTFDVGFERERVHRFAIDTGLGFTPAQRLELHKQVRTRLENLAGIRSVSISTCGLLDPCRSIGVMNNIPGHVFNRGEDRSLDRLDVGARFFETVGMPLLLGRDFTEADEWSGKGPRVGVINERMASRYFPGINPVGRHMQFDGLAPENDVEIIGVAKDSKYRSLREETIPVLYLPFSTAAQPRSFIVRTQGDMPRLANAVRDILRDVDPRLMLGQFQGTATNQVQSMGEIADASILRERLVAQLASFFGLAALFLVCIGLFGLVSYTVKRRTKEIGIRMAVGARRRDVIGLFARQMFPVLGIGVVAGLAGALLLGGLVANLLFGVEPTDARTITGASLLLIAASVAAAYLPLRRASRIDPTIALRHE